MNLAYNLNKNIPAQQIINDIQKLCAKIPKEEMESTILVITLQKIVSSISPDTPTITYNPPQ